MGTLDILPFKLVGFSSGLYQDETGFFKEGNLFALTFYLYDKNHLPVAHRPVVPHNSKLYKRVAAAATGLVAMVIFRSFVNANLSVC